MSDMLPPTEPTPGMDAAAEPGPSLPPTEPTPGVFVAGPGGQTLPPPPSYPVLPYGGGGNWQPPTYGNPPPWPQQPAPSWSMMPPATPAKAPRHGLRTAVIASVAAVVALGAGVGIGKIGGSSTPSASSAVGNQGSGGSSSNPFGGSGNSGSSNPFGSSGNSGSSSNPFGSSGNSGSSNSGSGSSSSGNTAISSQVDPGLVDINTTLSYQDAQAAGTGMVLTSNGEVLTNNHVIDGETSLSVTDIGNGRTYSATVLGYDRSHDIAVLQLHNASGLKTVSIGNSQNVSVGQAVVGIGNAGGTGGTPSAVAGSVTALSQSITASDESDGSSEQLTGLIQTNADIQPGDSGGPLVNSSGQVVGIDTAASSGYQFSDASSTGFAIPINRAVSIAQEITGGDSSTSVHIGATALLGVQVESPSAANQNNGGSGNGFGGLGEGNSGSGSGFGGLGDGNSGSGSNSGSTSGAYIAGVVSGSPASQAGLVQGDTIVSLNGQTVSSPSSISNIMVSVHPGDTVTLGWVDASGQSHSAKLQVKSGPPS